jgi:uncharacterized protein (TIGR03083 family)
MTVSVPVDRIERVTPGQAQHLAATEYSRLVAQLRTLDADDWSSPTDCPLWDVRAMAGHCVGMAADFTSVRNVVRRQVGAMRAAKADGVEVIDAMTAAQVAANASLSTSELVARAEEVGPQAARFRSHAPAWFRKLPLREKVGGQTETWRMGYLLDIVLTRDPWMHRTDIARATGHEPVLTADHDGVLVADAVAEWARRHGQPFTLELTGPAGGRFTAGTDAGEAITVDAVEFCRTVSGRAAGHGLLTQEVPF